MPPTGSTFTDWQQLERESRLLMDEDFSWSEPPRRRRRRIIDEPVGSRRRAALVEYEPEPFLDEPGVEAYDARDSRAPHAPAAHARAAHAPAAHARAAQAAVGHARTIEPERAAGAEAWDQPTTTHSHFDEMMEQWNAAYGGAAERAFDLDDPGAPADGQGARRTVVITGRGDDRYMPAPRRSPSSELRFHERSSFSPDRAGLWAVLLGIALLIGCIAH